jgi:hypothetical protein
MNERIKELAEQAGFQSIVRGDHIVFDISTKENMKEFAELIVRKCVDIIQRESDKAIRNNTYMGDDVPASVTQWAIKKHFGVEE